MDLEYYNSYLKVDLGILKENTQKIKQALEPGRTVIPVIKGNAHGMGTVPVAATLIEDLAIKTIACAHICEARDIRLAGFQDAKILILGAVPDHALPYAMEYDLHVPVFREETALLLNQLAADRGKRQPIQIKVDVGLHRIGVLPGEPLKKLVAVLHRCEKLEITGIYSHYANPYTPGDPRTLNQYECFHQSVEQVRALGIDPPMVHIACSGAAGWVPDPISTHARIGCMYVGFTEGPNLFNVRQAMTWRAFITNVMKLGPGEYVGYGLKNPVTRPMRVATLSIGACDGLCRPMVKGHGPVLLHGKRAPFISVCMDQSWIDVTDIPCKPGDQVTLFGQDIDTDAYLTTTELCTYGDGNPASLHELLSQRVKRVYVNR